LTFPLPSSLLPSSPLLLQVGQILWKATAGTGKEISLEIGGRSPFVVYDTADLDAAMEGVVDAIFFNQGQVCGRGCFSSGRQGQWYKASYLSLKVMHVAIM